MPSGYPQNIEQLHVALQRSFDGIKRDIEDIRTAHAFLIRANKDLADAIARTHQEAVTPDQINLLKIKLSDAAEEAKKASGTEKKLDAALDRIDARFRALKDQFSPASDVEKKISALSTKIDHLTSKTKQHLPTDEFNTFVDELNSELRQLHDHIERLEGEGGRVVDMRIDELRRELGSERKAIEEGTLRLEKMQEEFVPISSMERALEDINAEFDVIKADIEALRRSAGPVAAHRFVAEKASAKKGSARRGSTTTATDDDLDIEVIKTEGGSMERRDRRLLFWGNVMIALAFGSLFVSVLLTFLRKAPWDSYVLWGGGIGFMLIGTVLRIVGIVKSKAE